MTRRTTTTYICDGCGTEVENSKEIRRFVLQHRGRSGKWIDSDPQDLCEECEARLIAAVEPILGASTTDLLRPV